MPEPPMPKYLLLELLQLLLRGQPLADSLRPSYAFVAERGAPVGGPLSRGHRRPWRGYLNGLCRYGSNLTLAVSALATISSAMAANASSIEPAEDLQLTARLIMQCNV